MGQYYRPLMIFEDGEERSAYSHAFDNGLKLMEHSWVGNNFVNAVLHEIEDRPARVAWIGDYATDAVEDGCNFGDGYITSVEVFLEKYNGVWGEYRSVQDISPETPQYKLDLDSAGCYLVNATKKCYIATDTGCLACGGSTRFRFSPASGMAWEAEIIAERLAWEMSAIGRLTKSISHI